MTDLLAKTADFVNMASVSFAEAPFVDWLERDLRTLPHLELHRVGDNLVARTNWGFPQRLVLAGHTDTVPANDNGTARIEADTLYGVGSADMKGGLAVFHEIAHLVKPESDHEPAVDLTFVFYAREEVALEHSGLSELIEAQPDLLLGDCVILGEPTDGHVEAGCQGTMRVRVHLSGERAHTARPWMGSNAIHRTAPLLSALANYVPREPVIDGCHFIESIQAVLLEGGHAGNVVPDSAVVTIHHRYAPDQTDAEAEAAFLGWVGSNIDFERGDTIEVIDRAPCCPPSLNHPLLAALAAAGRQKSAKLGWTDVARFAQLGIPATNFGAGDPTVAHTQNEHLHRNSIERTYAALIELVTTPLA